MNTEDNTVCVCVYPSGKEKRKDNKQRNTEENMFVRNINLLFGVKDLRNLRPFLLRY
jgi:hypothetical protein